MPIRPPAIQSAVSLSDSEFLSYFGIDTDGMTRKEINEITYFVCLKHLSESVAKLPVHQYNLTEKKGRERVSDENIYRILNVQPNPYMTASDFWRAIELNRNHHGNGYALIKWYTYGPKKGRLKSLWPLDSGAMTMYVDDAGWLNRKNAIWYVYTENGKAWVLSPREVLHFKSSTTFNGLIGLAVKDILKTQIMTANYAEDYLQKLYRGNMFGGKVILQYTGDLDKTAKDTLIKNTERYANSVGTGKFLPIPMGVKAESMDMKLSDAEFTELNKLNALQIASAFGIKPNILNNYEKSSYSNSETQQLDFYINSLMPILKHYREEMTRKLLYKGFLEHDNKELFKLDPVKQMTVLKQGMNNFMYTINDVREELGKPYIDHPKANLPMGNGNYITLDQVGEQQKGAKTIETTEPSKER